MHTNSKRRAIAWMIGLCLATLPFGSLTVAEPTSALTTARRLVAAFNEHDPDKMASLVSKDFELYYVDDEGVATLAARGAEQLAEQMRGYFEHQPTVRSEIVAEVDGPVFVSFREQIVGGQSSLAVYEVREGRIRRVWYFPAEE